MKKVVLFTWLTAIFILGSFSIVEAKNYGLNSAAGNANYSITGSTDVYSMSQLIINGMLALIGFVFFGYTVYSGLRWLTAQGNQNAIDTAKSTLVSSIIGLAIVLSAYGLTNFVFDQLSK